MSSNKLILWSKCQLIIQAILDLPEDILALEETANELDAILCYYQSRTHQDSSSVITLNTIKGKLKAIETRPDFTLEP